LRILVQKRSTSYNTSIKTKKEAPLILNDNYLVSKGLLERCIASLKDKLNSEIPKKTQLIIEALTAKPITKAADEG